MNLSKGLGCARLSSRPARARIVRSPRWDHLEPRCLLSTADPTSLSNITATPSAVLYAPGQIRTVYRVNNLPSQDQGAGETIAIVDAYSDPNIKSDLATADAYASIPAPPSFTILNQNGKSSPLPRGNTGWGVEISLDVEWAHSIAPAAKLLLVEANTSLLSDLLKAVDTAASYSGVSVVSMSWGSSEFSGETSADSHFTTPAGHTGVTFVASSGDSGGVVEWPAASPKVLSVGGTTLNLNADNTWNSETAWGGSGGGTSSYEPSPSYQSGMGYSKRATPDVSYDADPNTGFYIYDTYGYGGVMGVGGTSAGAPQWAALVAIADGVAGHNFDGASQTLPAIYNVAKSAYSSNYHDITSGTAGQNHAGTGFDLVTGWGSPIFDSIVPAIALDPPGSNAVSAPPPASPPPSHGHGHGMTVVLVPPVAAPLAQHSVAIGVGSSSGLAVDQVAVVQHLAQISTSVSSLAASPNATSGPSSTTGTGTAGLGQDLLRARLTPSSAYAIAQSADGSLLVSETGRQAQESVSPHGPAVPGAHDAIAPAAPGGDEAQSSVGETERSARIERPGEVPSLPEAVNPPQSRLDPVEDLSTSQTRSDREAAWGACLLMGGAATLWNRRAASVRRASSRRFPSRQAAK
jgi:subtilase family serine protease